MSEHVEVVVSVTAYNPKDEVRPPNDRFEPEALQPTRTWDNTGDEQREAALYLVRDALTDLMGRLDEWVPRSFYADSGHRIDVKLSIELADVDNSIMLLQLRADREMDGVADDLRKMRDELDE